ncbi:MAG: TIM44-like domain-containing protein [Acidobacteriota bacterium]|nr:TIM44-like domain-containing protein [Acidobacteriota bacterium]
MRAVTDVIPTTRGGGQADALLPVRRGVRLALAVLLLLLLETGAGQARPGGGHTYSGSHSSGGSRSYSSHPSASPPSRPFGSGTPVPFGSSSRGGGSSGCGGIGCFLLLLVIVVIVVIVLLARRKGTGPPPVAPPPPPAPLDLDAIRGLDPDFSIVLFEDFAYALYAKAHEARVSRRDLDALAPYLSEGVRSHFAARPPAGAAVAGVVIGAMRAVGLSVPSPAAPPEGSPQPQIRLVLEFESNMTVGAPGSEVTQYVRERWQLVRNANVRSKPPEAVGTFHCPNCGAPFSSAAGGERCEYCGEVVSGGRFDWTVVAVEPLEIEDRPPSLTGTAEEEGTDLPTIVHPASQVRRAELLQDDPAATDEAIAARVQLIYADLNAAWTALDLAPVRPYVSDGLFDYLQYWIAAYRQQGLRNVLQGMHMTRWTLVKVIRDRYFDSLTFRIWATGRDSTVREATGEVVGGNPRADRNYSEYWTLIRGRSVRGKPRADKSCPNCGAPLAVSMAGDCEHCGAKITSGDFDWVLSKIEQDESYTG